MSLARHSYGMNPEVKLSPTICLSRSKSRESREHRGASTRIIHESIRLSPERGRNHHYTKRIETGITERE